jgi:hypothetical protein
MWRLRNQPLGTSHFRLAEGREGREILMRSEEAQIGKRVRVGTDHRKTWLGDATSKRLDRATVEVLVGRESVGDG